MVQVTAALSPSFAWAINNGMWTLGTKNPLDTVTELQKYTLAGVAQRIKNDVLILAGVEDHFVPIEQVAQFEKALTAARSVTTKVYDRSSGGAEHCQLGAQTPWHADFFDWMLAKFGDDNSRGSDRRPVRGCEALGVKFPGPLRVRWAGRPRPTCAPPAIRDSTAPA